MCRFLLLKLKHSGSSYYKVKVKQKKTKFCWYKSSKNVMYRNVKVFIYQK